MNGFEVCNTIRESGKNIPILMLTSRNTIDDKVRGFQSGSDDYLTKPFEYSELLMRIQALTRRSFSMRSHVIKTKDLEVDIEKKKVLKNGKEIMFTVLEFNLLVYLLQNSGKIVGKETLLEKVWGQYDVFSMTRTVDVYIGYLRKKLGKDLIQTIR
jgi:two-component system copper resistance phosphate regulon response regulator CusR